MTENIQNFIDEFKKTFIYDMLCESLEDEQLFEHSIVGGKVIWFKEQTRQMWLMWQAAKAKAVPEGFVLVSEDQAKDTERLNFLICGNKYIRTVVQRDIENDDYEKIGEHYLFTELHWIDGWDYHENTSSDTERGAIDKAMIEAQEQK